MNDNQNSRPHIDPRMALVRNALAGEQPPLRKRKRYIATPPLVAVEKDGYTFYTSNPNAVRSVGQQRMINLLLTPDREEAKAA